MKEHWDNVYITNNVNKAYELFFNKYLWLYNKNCPIKILNDKARNNNKPWLTKGILKSCKKKNKLNRDFVKYRTVNAEKKYKAYKNKLTTIMRRAKKDNYTNLLMENKSNIKRMWKVLMEVMGSKMNYSQPLYLMNEKYLTCTRMNVKIVKIITTMMVSSLFSLPELSSLHHCCFC